MNLPILKKRRKSQLPGKILRNQLLILFNFMTKKVLITGITGQD